MASAAAAIKKNAPMANALWSSKSELSDETTVFAGGGVGMTFVSVASDNSGCWWIPVLTPVTVSSGLDRAGRAALVGGAVATFVNVDTKAFVGGTVFVGVVETTFVRIVGVDGGGHWVSTLVPTTISGGPIFGGGAGSGGEFVGVGGAGGGGSGGNCGKFTMPGGKSTVQPT